MSTPLPISLYLHVPYCRSLCHYCDFAKTANFSKEHTSAYFEKLLQHLHLWQSWLEYPLFSSVFLGGGTPSLFREEWRPVFSALTQSVAKQAEITLETNPEDVSLQALEDWRGLGINRLSMGIQSFEPRGLAVMKRTHSAAVARQAVIDARAIMGSVNFDLIYGWPGQTFADWQRDLITAIELDPDHLSLYVLTFEPRTAMGRAFERGKIDAAADETLLAWYLHAREVLTAAGYEHAEVSNFAKPGRLSVHNRHYWRHGHYVGIGTGAHGFVPGGEWGERYAYARNDRLFLKHELPKDAARESALNELGQWERERTRATWLTELVLTGLRTAEGIDLERATREAQAEFVPQGLVAEALGNGDLTLVDDRLRLSPTEWFREGAWAAIVRDCIV